MTPIEESTKHLTFVSNICIFTKSILYIFLHGLSPVILDLLLFIFFCIVLHLYFKRLYSYIYMMAYHL